MKPKKHALIGDRSSIHRNIEICTSSSSSISKFENIAIRILPEKPAKIQFGKDIIFPIKFILFGNFDGRNTRISFVKKGLFLRIEIFDTDNSLLEAVLANGEGRFDLVFHDRKIFSKNHRLLLLPNSKFRTERNYKRISKITSELLGGRRMRNEKALREKRLGKKNDFFTGFLYAGMIPDDFFRFGKNANNNAGLLAENIAAAFGGKIVGEDNSYGGADVKIGKMFWQIKNYGDLYDLRNALIEHAKNSGNFGGAKYQVNKLNRMPLEKAKGNHQLLDPSLASKAKPMKVRVAKGTDIEKLKRLFEEKCRKMGNKNPPKLEIECLPFTNKFIKRACSPFTAQSFIVDAYCSTWPFLQAGLISFCMSFGMDLGLKMFFGICRGDSLKTILRNTFNAKEIARIVLKSSSEAIKSGLSVMLTRMIVGQLSRVFSFDGLKTAIGNFGVSFIPVIVSTGFEGARITLKWIISSSKNIKTFSIDKSKSKNQLVKDQILITSRAACDLFLIIPGTVIGYGVGYGLGFGGTSILSMIIPNFAPFVDIVGNICGYIGSSIGGFTGSIISKVVALVLNHILDSLIADDDSVYLPIYRDQFLRVMIDDFGALVNEDSAKSFMKAAYSPEVLKRVTGRMVFLCRERDYKSYQQRKAYLRKILRQELRNLFLEILLEELSRSALKGKCIPKLPSESDVVNEMKNFLEEELTEESKGLSFKETEVRENEKRSVNKKKEKYFENEKKLKESTIVNRRNRNQKNSDIFSIVCGGRFMIYRIHEFWGIVVMEYCEEEKYRWKTESVSIVRFDEFIDKVMFCVCDGKKIRIFEYNALNFVVYMKSIEESTFEIREGNKLKISKAFCYTKYVDEDRKAKFSGMDIESTIVIHDADSYQTLMFYDVVSKNKLIINVKRDDYSMNSFGYYVDVWGDIDNGCSIAYVEKNRLSVCDISEGVVDGNKCLYERKFPTSTELQSMFVETGNLIYSSSDENRNSVLGQITRSRFGGMSQEEILKLDNSGVDLLHVEKNKILAVGDKTLWICTKVFKGKELCESGAWTYDGIEIPNSRNRCVKFSGGEQCVFVGSGRNILRVDAVSKKVDWKIKLGKIWNHNIRISMKMLCSGRYISCGFGGKLIIIRANDGFVTDKLPPINNSGRLVRGKVIVMD